MERNIHSDKAEHPLQQLHFWEPWYGLSKTLEREGITPATLGPVLSNHALQWGHKQAVSKLTFLLLQPAVKEFSDGEK